MSSTIRKNGHFFMSVDIFHAFAGQEKGRSFVILPSGSLYQSILHIGQFHSAWFGALNPVCLSSG